MRDPSVGNCAKIMFRILAPSNARIPEKWGKKKNATHYDDKHDFLFGGTLS